MQCSCFFVTLQKISGKKSEGGGGEVEGAGGRIGNALVLRTEQMHMMSACT